MTLFDIYYAEAREALGNPLPPKEIRQETFDYFDLHLKRILANVPSPYDLFNYLEDIRYCPVDVELLAFVLPRLLATWKADLLDGTSGAFRDNFWSPIACTPILLTCLASRQYSGATQYLVDGILERIDRETSLLFEGNLSHPQQWCCELGAYAVAFPDIRPIWTPLWAMETRGRAIDCLQYLSCLLYDDSENPIFAPWTPERGGGSMCLWDVSGHIYDRGWRPENAKIVEESLTCDTVRNYLELAQAILSDSDVPKRMLDEFDSNSVRLELRLIELPTLLMGAYEYCSSWSV